MPDLASCRTVNGRLPEKFPPGGRA